MKQIITVLTLFLVLKSFAQTIKPNVVGENIALSTFAASSNKKWEQMMGKF